MTPSDRQKIFEMAREIKDIAMGEIIYMDSEGHDDPYFKILNMAESIQSLTKPESGIQENRMDKEIKAVQNYIARSQLYYLEEGKGHRKVCVELAEWGISRIQRFFLTQKPDGTGGEGKE